MPAAKLSYLVFYTNESQVYGCASREIALSSPPPPGTSIEDKRILFVTYRPDDEILSVHPLPQEEVLSSELVYKKPPKKKGEDGQEENHPEGS